MLTNMNMTLILTQQRDDIAYQRLVATMCSLPSLVFFMFREKKVVVRQRPTHRVLLGPREPARYPSTDRSGG